LEIPAKAFEGVRMPNKKSQGLPMSFIVLAAISALILVLIVFFVTGAGGRLMGAIAGAQETDKTTAISQCQSLCQQAQTAVTTDAFKSSSYCTKKFTITEGTTKSVASCFGTSLNVACAVGIGDKTCGLNTGGTACQCIWPGCHGKATADEATCSPLAKAACEANALCSFDPAV
jgi:hypothetical protein